ncbi:PaaI family thioesterase [Ralstonia wenshanensis]|uniref:PaaI family thioesterase n=1 Tax=Ralstonia wenshanensis TaxID=2842456 RepID=UPI0039C5E6A2
MMVDRVMERWKAGEARVRAERWMADEATVRARLRDPDTAPQGQVAGRSGMEVFEAIFAGELPPPPIGDTLDFVPIHMALGEAIFQGRPQRRHYNPLGTVHGGWFATLLDSAVGCAIHTTLPAGKGYTTLELKVNMVRPLNDGVPLVRAEGKVIHAGRQVATAEGRIVGPDGKLYAHATTTCLIFDHPAFAARSSHEQS